MKSIRLIALLLVLLLPASGALAWGDKSTTQQYESAVALLQAGSYTEAAAAFTQISGYEDASRMAMYCSAIDRKSVV